MIRRLYLNNLRCLVNFELDLTDQTGVLIVGRNGSGKSSVIDALEILSSVALGRSSFREKLPLSVFSRLSSNLNGSEERPPLRFRLEAGLPQGHRANYEIEFEWSNVDDEAQVQSERLDVDGIQIFARSAANVSLRMDPSSNNTFPLDRHICALSSIQEPNQDHPLRWFKDWLSNVLVIKPEPERITGLSSVPTRNLVLDASNCADWYRWIVTTDPELGSYVNKLLRSIWPDLKAIRNDQRGPSTYDLHLEFSQEGQRSLRVRLGDLSQGEKIIFLWATLLAWMQINPNSVCVWDEVDEHIALFEVQGFIRTLGATVGQGGQLIATSHTTEAVRSFASESVLVLYRSDRLQPTREPRFASTMNLPTEDGLASILARGEEEEAWD